MAETISGGAYLRPDGKTWVDANGVVLSKEAAAEAQKLSETRQRDRELAEAERVEFEASRDPIARALLAQQASRQAVAAPRASEK
jgi:hypothetical protein